MVVRSLKKNKTQTSIWYWLNFILSKFSVCTINLFQQKTKRKTERQKLFHFTQIHYVQVRYTKEVRQRKTVLRRMYISCQRDIHITSTTAFQQYSPLGYYWRRLSVHKAKLVQNKIWFTISRSVSYSID